MLPYLVALLSCLPQPVRLQHTCNQLTQHNLGVVSPLPMFAYVSNALERITVSHWLHAGATARGSNTAQGWAYHV